MGEDSKEEGMNVYGGRWGRSGDHYKEKRMLKLDSVVWTEHFQLAESKKDILSIRQGSQAVRHLLYLKKNKWFSIIEKEIVWCSEARERWDEMRERDPLGLAVFFWGAFYHQPPYTNWKWLKLSLSKNGKMSDFLEIFYKCSWGRQAITVRTVLTQLKSTWCEEEVQYRYQDERGSKRQFGKWSNLSLGVHHMASWALCSW